MSSKPEFKAIILKAVKKIDENEKGEDGKGHWESLGGCRGKARTN